MTMFEMAGMQIRVIVKRLIVLFMADHPDVKSGKGVTATEIFRGCGLDWGDKPEALSRNQVSWLNAALRELESAGVIYRDVPGKRGRWLLSSRIMLTLGGSGSGEARSGAIGGGFPVRDVVSDVERNPNFDCIINGEGCDGCIFKRLGLI